MSRAATSIFVYGIYLVGQALALMVIPNVALGLFGLPSTDEVWVRVLGYAVLALGIYFLVAARREVIAFFQVSIPVRLGFPVVLTIFVALGYAKPALILLAPADVIFALWTAWGLWSARPAIAAAK